MPARLSPDDRLFRSRQHIKLAQQAIGQEPPPGQKHGRWIRRVQSHLLHAKNEANAARHDKPEEVRALLAEIEALQPRVNP